MHIHTHKKISFHIHMLSSHFDFTVVKKINRKQFVFLVVGMNLCPFVIAFSLIFCKSAITVNIRCLYYSSSHCGYGDIYFCYANINYIASNLSSSIPPNNSSIFDDVIVICGGGPVSMEPEDGDNDADDGNVSRISQRMQMCP